MNNTEIKTIVVYQQGTPKYVNPSLPSVLIEILARSTDGDVSFNTLIGESTGDFSRTQWLMLLRDVFGDVLKNAGEQTNYQRLLVRLCQTLTTKDERTKIWGEIKKLLVENADVASGWNESPHRLFSEKQPIQREGDVYTYKDEDDGKTYRVFGIRTDREERVDHIFGSCLGYGNISTMFKFIVLFFLCQRLSQSSDFLPSGIHLALTEYHPLDWYWHLRWPYRARVVEWRPDDNLLDPKWLGADLLIDLATKEGVTDQEMLPNDFKTPGAKFDTVFKGYHFQLDLAVETPARFDGVLETYFEFEGVPLRWVNQNDHRMSVLTIPSKNGMPNDETYQLALRFLSKISFQYDLPFVVMTGISGRKRPYPWINQPKQMGGVILPENFPLKEFKTKDVNKHNLALSFYREGKGAESVYYAFFNFYKIIALQFDDAAEQCIPWINQNLSRIGSHIAKERLANLQKRVPDVGNYLYTSGRCAIAHVRQEPIAKPDDLADNHRLSHDLPIIEALARYVIETPCL